MKNRSPKTNDYFLIVIDISQDFRYIFFYSSIDLVFDWIFIDLLDYLDLMIWIWEMRDFPCKKSHWSIIDILAKLHSQVDTSNTSNFFRPQLTFKFKNLTNI